MDLFILFRYIHFIGIFSVVGALVTESFMVKDTLTHHQVEQLAKVDGLYGIGAIVTLGAGFMMWFGVGKPAIFYTHNWIFHTKVLVFLIAGILSIWPTVFFMKNREGDDDGIIEVPKRIRAFIRIELALIVLLPLLASLMARGIGSF